MTTSNLQMVVLQTVEVKNFNIEKLSFDGEYLLYDKKEFCLVDKENPLASDGVELNSVYNRELIRFILGYKGELTEAQQRYVDVIKQIENLLYDRYPTTSNSIIKETSNVEGKTVLFMTFNLNNRTLFYDVDSKSKNREVSIKLCQHSMICVPRIQFGMCTIKGERLLTKTLIDNTFRRVGYIIKDEGITF